MPTRSGHRLCQTVPPWLSVPAAGSWPVTTLTFSSLPWATVTVTPLFGLTCALPLAGVMDTCATALDLAVVVWPVCDPCWPFDAGGAELEHAATSRHNAPQMPVIASPARRPVSKGRRPVRNSSLSRTSGPPVVLDPTAAGGYPYGHGFSWMEVQRPV